jgi:hypothetical protein
MAVTDRSRERCRIARLHGQLVAPGEQEVVEGAVRLGKRDLHYSRW